jgi:multiple sugar transport system substrate-binding protein
MTKRFAVAAAAILLLAFFVAPTVFAQVKVIDLSTLTTGKILAPEKAKVNWRQAAGTTLNIVMVKHFCTEALKDILPQFEKLTGIKVKIDEFPDADYFAKVGSGFESGTLPYDAYMANPVMLIKEYSRGWIEDLNQFINDPALTDKSWYDVNDIFDAGKRAGTIDGKFCFIPIMGGAHGFVYRADLVKQAGVAVPTTFKELTEASKAIKEKTHRYGYVSRGAFGMFCNLWPWVWSYGSDWYDENWNAALTDPTTVQAIKDFVFILTKYGPPGITAYDWYEELDAMNSGSTAFFYDSFGCWRWLKDPALVSYNVDDLKMGAPLKGPSGKAYTIWDSWAMGMPKSSKNKTAAWLLIEWTTSKAGMLGMALGQVYPARTSVAEDARLAKAFQPDFQKYAKESLACAKPFPSTSEFFEWQQIVIESVQAALTGKKSVEDALAEGNQRLQAVIDAWRQKPESKYTVR